MDLSRNFGALMITPEQVTLVRTSWGTIAEQGLSFVDVLYEELFSAEPQLRILFEGPMDEQHRKLTAVITHGVAQLHDPVGLKNQLHELGARHVDYGVKAYHFDALGRAWLIAVERQLGEACTPDIQAAWGAFYALLKEGMGEGASLAPAQQH